MVTPMPQTDHRELAGDLVSYYVLGLELVGSECVASSCRAYLLAKHVMASSMATWNG